MNIGILYLCMSFIYILLICLDGEDVKPKWKQWLADKLGIKPKIEVRYIKPQVVKLHSRVTMSNFEMQYYLLRNKSYNLVPCGLSFRISATLILFPISDFFIFIYSSLKYFLTNTRSVSHFPNPTLK